MAATHSSVLAYLSFMCSTADKQHASLWIIQIILKTVVIRIIAFRNPFHRCLSKGTLNVAKQKLDLNKYLLISYFKEK